MEQRESCCICGNTNPKEVIRVGYNDDPIKSLLTEYYDGAVDFSLLSDEAYVIDYCPVCHHYWKEYVLDSDGMEQLYSEWLSTPDSEEIPQKKYSSWQTEFGIEDASRIKSYLEKHPRDIRVLDYGGGYCWFAKLLDAFGFETYFYDVSESKAELARKHGISTIDSIDAIEDIEFDYIHMNQVLEHVPSPQKTVRTVADLLSTDGFAYVAVPDAASAGHDPKRIVEHNAFHPLEHINCFTHESLRKLMSEHELEQIRPPQPLLTLSRFRKWTSVLETPSLKLPLYRFINRVLSPMATGAPDNRTGTKDGTQSSDKELSMFYELINALSLAVNKTSVTSIYVRPK